MGVQEDRIELVPRERGKGMQESGRSLGVIGSRAESDILRGINRAHDCT